MFVPCPTDPVPSRISRRSASADANPFGDARGSCLPSRSRPLQISVMRNLPTLIAALQLAGARFLSAGKDGLMHAATQPTNASAVAASGVPIRSNPSVLLSRRKLDLPAELEGPARCSAYGRAKSTLTPSDSFASASVERLTGERKPIAYNLGALANRLASNRHQTTSACRPRQCFISVGLQII